MLQAVIDLFRINSTFWTLAGLVAIYIAGRAILDARIKPASSSAARLAWTLTLIVGTLVLLALALDRPAVAVGLLFTTSVASLALVCGLAAILAPIPALPPASRRIWFFLLPVAILTLLAGFSGRFTLTHAAVLAMQGALILYVRSDPRVGADEDWAAPVLLFDNTVQPKPHRPFWRWIELVLAVLLLAIGGFFVMDAARAPASKLAHFSDVMLAVGVLSPVALLPLIGMLASFSQRGRVRVAVGASVLLTIFNLCVLLPATVVLWMVRPAIIQLFSRAHPGIAALDGADIGPIAQFNHTMPFPMQVWRIDTVVLVILALAALPVALGKFTVSRREGVGLVVLYAFYLVTSAVVALRY